MSKDGCPRCGLESSCPHGSWPDRHPAAAVIAGIFTLVWASMMFSVYPVASLIMTGLGAAVWGVRATGRERRRRGALVARADWEHQAVMAASPAPRPVVQLPRTLLTAMAVEDMRRRPSVYAHLRRPADHRSITQPIRRSA